ncbi:MAG: LCP family protein [Ancrocorticia sp.]
MSNRRAEAHLLVGPRNRHIGRVALLVFLALALIFGSAAATAWHSLQSNINQTNIDNLLDRNGSGPIDAAAGRPINILVLGSDIREGDSDIDGSGELGITAGMRADTTMLFHVSKDRSRVEVVSIPRDLLVDIPSCTVREGEDYSKTFTTEGWYDQFNFAFSTGGQTGDVASAAACSMKTVEALTKVKLDGYVVINFASFQDIVNALGGIPMYFEEPLYDDFAGLDVPAGCRLLDGQQSLALARARYAVGDGSDIGRIGRQQELVFAILNEAKNMNLFTDMPRLYRILQAATANLDTSEGLGDIPTIAGLANSLRNIDLANIQFITTPWEPAGDRVITLPDAEVLWNAIAKDHPVASSTDEFGKISIQDLTLNTAQPEVPVDAGVESPATQAPTTQAPIPTDLESQVDETPTAPDCNRDVAKP